MKTFFKEPFRNWNKLCLKSFLCRVNTSRSKPHFLIFAITFVEPLGVNFNEVTTALPDRTRFAVFVGLLVSVFQFVVLIMNLFTEGQY